MAGLTVAAIESQTFTQFRFNEKYLSQIPAQQLFIQMGYTYLPPRDVLPLRQGKRSNVLLEPILRAKLQELNRITFCGQEYHFSEANIQEAIQRLKKAMEQKIMLRSVPIEPPEI